MIFDFCNDDVFLLNGVLCWCSHVVALSSAKSNSNMCSNRTGLLPWWPYVLQNIIQVMLGKRNSPVVASILQNIIEACAQKEAEISCGCVMFSLL